MTAEEPAARVTLQAIYDRVVSVEAQVAKLNGDLPSHVTLTKVKQEEYETRLENHGDRLGTLDTRMTAIETKVAIIEAQKKPPAPWYSVVAGVVGIITGIGSLLAILAVLSKLSTI